MKTGYLGTTDSCFTTLDLSIVSKREKKFQKRNKNNKSGSPIQLGIFRLSHSQNVRPNSTTERMQIKFHRIVAVLD